MSYSPPTKRTIIISFLLLIIGIVLGLLGFLGLVKGYNDIFIYIGFGLIVLSWLLMYIGVRFRGL
ncbi:MAG: hypothetical protein ACFFAH_06565 [Promethearchaeota archaeon]